MTDFALSVNNVPIRLTGERWRHIVENHDDMAGYYYDILEAVSSPTWVVEGDANDLWAVKLTSQRKALLVIYKEMKEQKDGFIITAFVTTKIKKLLKGRRIVWQQPQQ
ncbi:MAG: hypothetical protein HY805_08490 [Nitrospirae bacterium]|nr:hypothetical protein [Nitrospirota bacterium]